MPRKESGLTFHPLLIIAAVAAVAILFVLPKSTETQTPLENFEDCVAAGNPVLESYPEQCMADGKGFTRDIGNELEKLDLITVSDPRPNTEVSSPLIITGQARGTWFFEASFPVYLYDEQGNEIAVGYAQAEGDWMTEDFVQFTSTLEFDDTLRGKGTLVLKKDNPSGLPENDDELRIPVILSAQ